MVTKRIGGVPDVGEAELEFELLSDGLTIIAMVSMIERVIGIPRLLVESNGRGSSQVPVRTTVVGTKAAREGEASVIDRIEMFLKRNLGRVMQQSPLAAEKR